MTPTTRCLTAALLMVAVIAPTATSGAQPPAPGTQPPAQAIQPPAQAIQPPAGGFGALQLSPIGGPVGGLPQGDGIDSVEAQFTPATADQPARLFVTAQISDGWHIYSVTQPPGGPIRTAITIAPNDAVLDVGDFQPIAPPEQHREVAFGGLAVESHYGTVTWYAPIKLAANVDPSALTIDGTVMAQACTDSACLPPKKFPFTAKLGDEATVLATVPSVKPGADAAGSDGTYQPASANVAIRGRVEPGEQPGSYRLVITAEPSAGYHVYELVEQETGQSINKPTLLVLIETSVLDAGRPSADEPIVEKPSPLPDYPPSRLYEGAVNWTIKLTAPEGLAPTGAWHVEGLLGYQVCSDTACDMPQAVQFAVDVPADVAAGDTIPVSFTTANYSEAAALAKTHPWPAATFDPAQIAVNTAEASELWIGEVLFYGFLGGMILNLMPCVLPVVGLKIMSFVSQAGESRARVLALNIWFSLGLMSVFVVLAGLAIFAQMGWGTLFASNAFTIVMAAVVFAMGLSLLGVWEIPIPGFVGGTTAHGLESREGASGAFSKGVITTILATPCSGPYMGTALTWALRQPSAHILAVFMAIGLGMASPYLVIGAFPQLIRFLPKPGNWMVTFKSIMGFVLLGTVVYLLYLTGEQLVVPTVALLVGIGVACWRIGQTPLTSARSKVARAWVEAAAVTIAIAVFSFGWFGNVINRRFERNLNRTIAARISETGDEASSLVLEHEGELPWEPYTRARLEELVGAEKTVLVDFTADWCATCQVLEATVLNTEAIRAAVDENRVVTLVADWSDLDPGVTEMLNILGANQVPVLAIFPAGRPNQPIVLVDGYTQKLLLTKLDEAGPSLDLASGQQADGHESSRTAARSAP